MKTIQRSKMSTINQSEFILSNNKIFNVMGERDANKRKIILGNSTFINELNEIKYNWAYELYHTMAFTNFWVPEEISMLDDKKMFNELTEYEKRAYKLVLSFLIVLDSYQVNMLKEFARKITAPEIIMALTAQEFQEALHSKSYQYILESVVPTKDIDKVYNLWREDQVLLERNAVIAELYNNFIDNPTLENFVKALIGNYLLESLYFYSGFTFFYNLGAQSKMINTMQQIKYINRDELTHVTLFKNLINELRKEYKDLFTPELTKWIVEYTKFAAEKEIEWAHYITKEQITGLNNYVLRKYIEYIANLRLTYLGFEPIYEVGENPLKHLEKLATISNSKTDFFQSKPQNYQGRNTLKW